VIDFIALSRAARELPGTDTHDRLWSAWFAQPVWHFIKAPSPSGWLPYSRVLGPERCVLGFTDPQRAEGYARFAALPIDPRVHSAVLPLAPESAIQLVPQLRSWSVSGLVVDIGPDQFYTRLDTLAVMYQRFRMGAPAPPPPPKPQPPPSGLDRPSAGGPNPLARLETVMALSQWYLVTTTADPSFPEFTHRGADLVAQVYSSPYRAGARPTAVMTPAAVIALLSDIELVGLVRIDDEIEMQLVDLALSFRTSRP
jgi:hypothetical protein